MVCPALVLAEAELVPLSVTGARPHSGYTQGLFLAGGFLYKSSGLYGQSAVEKIPFPDTKGQAAIHKPPDEFFAEGAALADGEVYLLTWRENTLWVLDAENLTVKRRLRYEGEGWGLAFDGERLWRSDGSAGLHPHSVGDFSPAGEAVMVSSGRHYIDRLNELEWDPVNRVMLANVYGSDYIAVIDLAGGGLLHWLDGRPLRKLAEKAGLASDWATLNTALNGLALSPDGRGLWLTGKLWPEMYRVAWPPDFVKQAEKTAGPRCPNQGNAD